MIELIIASIIVVGLCVFGLSINIIFKKDGKFPDKEISHNKDLRKQGIICAKDEERRLWVKNHGRPSKEGVECKSIGCTNCSHSCF